MVNIRKLNIGEIENNESYNQRHDVAFIDRWEYFKKRTIDTFYSHKLKNLKISNNRYLIINELWFEFNLLRMVLYGEIYQLSIIKNIDKVNYGYSLTDYYDEKGNWEDDYFEDQKHDKRYTDAYRRLNDHNPISLFHPRHIKAEKNKKIVLDLVKDIYDLYRQILKDAGEIKGG